MFGPIQRLRLCGSLCPCFESEEEHALRVADMLLKSVPVRWYRKLRVSPYSMGGDTLMGATNDVVFKACYGCYSSQQIPAAVRKPTTLPTTTQYVGIDASLDVIDTRQGPALLIASNDYSFVDDDNESSSQMPAMQTMKKIIPLKDIQMAARGDGKEWETMGLEGLSSTGIIVYSKTSKDPQDDTSEDRTEIRKKLLVFQVMPGSKLSLTRDEAMKHLNTLISWDRVGPIEDESQAIVPYDDKALDYHALEKDGKESNERQTSDSQAIAPRQSSRTILVPHHRVLPVKEID
jgi:hypothetical protein